VATRESYVPKLPAMLPAAKVARYLQIENKIRAVIKYELASDVPLVPWTVARAAAWVGDLLQW
jgi:hypothetical protein